MMFIEATNRSRPNNYTGEIDMNMEKWLTNHPKIGYLSSIDVTDVVAQYLGNDRSVWGSAKDTPTEADSLDHIKVKLSLCSLALQKDRVFICKVTDRLIQGGGYYGLFGMFGENPTPTMLVDLPAEASTLSGFEAFMKDLVSKHTELAANE